ncbi:MAG: Holliday junction branch migration protein RuvA [Acetobacter sp.]|nr:Holliday junction branch migration protein RuvA [Acetobacter sp.]MBO6036819.1 Holliday junction branch migration protein RuvA [Acetobacter sp.]MBO6043300.1 Holliday junction branch migration protein RuvA [Acetobacter sp.]MBO6084997.1 Holliday junction branch migration protein RuvA [Acetobacter sp.]MBO7350705.1 Holliday junction branch migration protein RuvA [Acetobacter sp.]
MIASLSGFIIYRDTGSCVVDVNGVGYLVATSSRTLATLPSPPEKTNLLIETIVREDAILLYGFIENNEREWFRQLTSVQGVGAKMALSILSTLTLNELETTFTLSDKTSLMRTPGIGNRLALRILTELRDKVSKIFRKDNIINLPPTISSNDKNNRTETDALIALTGLGFQRLEASRIVRRIMHALGPEAPLDIVIRDSLKELDK